ncbi:MAG TPA: hypothetical protein VNE39_00370 [Planctomycetota bacterium]|nr:hypothetical protein [Planctomycetota bacterium]
MIDFARCRALLLDRCNSLLGASRPFGDIVLPGREASNLLHVTDLVWVKHILGDLTLAEGERDSWAERIRRDQEPHTGLFRYPPGEHHIAEHATWQAVAALNLLGRRPRHRLACLEPLLTQDGFRAWCDGFRPGTSHHRFFLAVLAAASTPVSDGWKAVFGAWYDSHQDAATGFPLYGNSPHCLSPAFLLTTVRFAFCGPPRRADQIVETTLAFQTPCGGVTGEDLPGYMEMDAAYLLHLLGPAAGVAPRRIEAALERLGAFVEAVVADASRRERLLADPHRALAACGTLSVLRRHMGTAGQPPLPFPWAELQHFRVEL